MDFTTPLVEGRLLKRYKRFLADVQLGNGEIVTAHCANTGSMKNCQPENARVWLSRSDNPKRKLAYSWELVEVVDGVLAGINTASSNRLVREAIEQGVIRELEGYPSIRAEVKYGLEGSRIDFLLQQHASQPDCYLEVKDVTLWDGQGNGSFPDAVTARGTKHLRELITMVAQGHRAALCFCVQHTGIQRLRPADEIDPLYGKTLREAIAAGVEVFAYRAAIDINHVALTEPLSLVINEDSIS